MTNILQELDLLSKPNVHIKNPDRVNEILDNFIKDGVNKIQVVSDFDKTITKSHENGKSHLSSFAMFSMCPSVPVEYKETAKALANKYYPIELDPSIPRLEKIKLMEEWWGKSEIALKGLKISQQEIEEACFKLGPPIRDGSQDVFNSLNEMGIPLLVFSAGLGDTIVAVLKHYNVLLPNVKIISNFLKYDSDGHIDGFKGRIIHVLNKNEFAIKDSDFYADVKDRENIILMGDSLGDAEMGDGMDHLKNILKIGFLCDNVDTVLESYKDTFDIVLVNDQTMNVPRIIIDRLKNN